MWSEFGVTAQVSVLGTRQNRHFKERTPNNCQFNINKNKKYIYLVWNVFRFN